MLEVEAGTIIHPDSDQPMPNGVIVWDTATKIIRFSGTRQQLQTRPDLKKLTVSANEEKSSKVILPGSADTHTHAFQPEGIPGVLIENVAEMGKKPNFQGWLPETLRFESIIRANPEKARMIARYRFEQYIQHGITASLEYTTSSIEAARIVLEEAHRAKLGSRIKVGYVAMDQEVDFIEGVQLEVKGEVAQDKVLGQIEELAKDFPQQVVIIDRFPIAVSSPYRKKLVALAKKLGIPYETHVDESKGEWEIHNGIYQRRIMKVLKDDGVFDEGMEVGLAHGVHTKKVDFRTVEAAVRRGVPVHVRFCPDSNGNLGSHTWGTNYRPMPFEAWRNSGATISLGTDKGAGTGWSIFAEALKERARPHAGASPTEAELLAMATTSGLRSLKLNDSLKEGETANFVVVDAGSPFREELPDSLNELAAVTLRAGQNPQNVAAVVVNGQRLK